MSERGPSSGRERLEMAVSKERSGSPRESLNKEFGFYSKCDSQAVEDFEQKRELVP